MGKEPGIYMVTEAWGSWVPPSRVGEGNGRLGGWAIGSLWAPDHPTKLCHFCLGLWNHLLLFTYHFCQCIAEKLVQSQILPWGCKIRIPRPQEGAKCQRVTTVSCRVLWQGHNGVLVKQHRDTPQVTTMQFPVQISLCWFILHPGDGQYSHSRWFVYPRAVIPNSTPGRAETSWQGYDILKMAFWGWGN